MIRLHTDLLKTYGLDNWETEKPSKEALLAAIESVLEFETIMIGAALRRREVKMTQTQIDLLTYTRDWIASNYPEAKNERLEKMYGKFRVMGVLFEMSEQLEMRTRTKFDVWLEDEFRFVPEAKTGFTDSIRLVQAAEFIRDNYKIPRRKLI